MLLTEGKTSPPFRDGGAIRLWRLSAEVSGKHGEQFEKSSLDPLAAWAGHSIAHSRATH